MKKKHRVFNIIIYLEHKCLHKTKNGQMIPKFILEFKRILLILKKTRVNI